MNRRLFSVLAAGALIASALSMTPVNAAQEIPSDEDANIVDPAADANGLNDQGLGLGFGDNSGGPYFGGADFLKIWFTNTADSVSVHMLTTAPGTGGNFAYTYRVHVNDNCIWFQGSVDGASNTDEPSALLRDACNGADPVEGEIVVEEVGDGQGLTTLTFPMGAFSDLEVGKTLATPFATSRLRGPSGHTAPQLDDTQVGKDYEISSGGDDPSVGKTPPGKNDPPGKGKKKGCPKGKGKKKGACPGKKSKPKACGNYQPGELGAEAETIKITEAATEEEPLEQTVELEASTADFNPADEVTTAYFNVQANTKPKDDVGLWVLFEFPMRRDYDLALFYPDGSYGARARGFNTAAETPFSTAGHGGEHGPDYEKLLGIRTQRCGGWTVEASNHFGEGGEFAIKLWLGPIETDPMAPGEETP